MIKIKQGTLIIVPTPINEELPLEICAKSRIENALTINSVRPIFIFEEKKLACKRWIKWGFPREEISSFIYLNEHDDSTKLILKKIQEGHDAYIMSDCGLPAFCDPGTKLIDLCHNHGIQVTSTPFCNSLMLALVLSGFSYKTFTFKGFVPNKMPERALFLKNLGADVIAIMDTPYRLSRLIRELCDISKNKEIFLAMNLNLESELLLRGTANFIEEKLKKLGITKGEFVLILKQ